MGGRRSFPRASRGTLRFLREQGRGRGTGRAGAGEPTAAWVFREQRWWLLDASTARQDARTPQIQDAARVTERRGPDRARAARSALRRRSAHAGRPGRTCAGASRSSRWRESVRYVPAGACSGVRRRGGASGWAPGRRVALRDCDRHQDEHDEKNPPGSEQVGEETKGLHCGLVGGSRAAGRCGSCFGRTEPGWPSQLRHRGLSRSRTRRTGSARTTIPASTRWSANSVVT